MFLYIKKKSGSPNVGKRESFCAIGKRLASPFVPILDFYFCR